MDKRLILIIALLCSAVATEAQTERRIYTKAEQESAQKHKIEKRIEAIQDSIAQWKPSPLWSNWILYWKPTDSLSNVGKRRMSLPTRISSPSQMTRLSYR